MNKTFLDSIKYFFSERCNLKRSDKLLIICDENYGEFAFPFWQFGKIRCKQAILTLIPRCKHTGNVLPESIESFLPHFDIVLMISSNPYIHSSSIYSALSKDTRIIACAGSTEQDFIESVKVDYRRVAVIGRKIASYLENGNRISISSSMGTDLHFEIDKSKIFIDDGTIMSSGSLGYYPSGEVSFSPLPLSAQGVISIDSYFNGTHSVDQIINLHIKDGKILKIISKGPTKELENIFSRYRQGATLFSEFGIGLCDDLPTESFYSQIKKIGNFHFAFGNNQIFKINQEIELHLDCLQKGGQLLLDGKVILENGILISGI